MKLTASAEGKIEIERFILILNLGLSIAFGFSGCTYNVYFTRPGKGVVKCVDLSKG